MSNKLTKPDRAMSNFSFVPQEFGQLGLSARMAEKYVRGLEMLYDTGLGAMLHAPGLREVGPEEDAL